MSIAGRLVIATRWKVGLDFVGRGELRCRLPDDHSWKRPPITSQITARSISYILILHPFAHRSQLQILNWFYLRYLWLLTRYEELAVWICSLNRDLRRILILWLQSHFRKLFVFKEWFLQCTVRRCRLPLLLASLRRYIWWRPFDKELLGIYQGILIVFINLSGAIISAYVISLRNLNILGLLRWILLVLGSIMLLYLLDYSLEAQELLVGSWFYQGVALLHGWIHILIQIFSINLMAIDPHIRRCLKDLLLLFLFISVDSE